MLTFAVQHLAAAKKLCDVMQHKLKQNANIYNQTVFTDSGFFCFCFFYVVFPSSSSHKIYTVMCFEAVNFSPTLFVREMTQKKNLKVKHQLCTVFKGLACDRILLLFPFDTSSRLHLVVFSLKGTLLFQHQHLT